MGPVIQIQINARDRCRDAKGIDQIPESFDRPVCISDPSVDHPERILAYRGHRSFGDDRIDVLFTIGQLRPVVDRAQYQGSHENQDNIAKEFPVARRRNGTQNRSQYVEPYDHRDIPQMIWLDQPSLKQIQRCDLGYIIHHMKPVDRVHETPEHIRAGHFNDIFLPDLRRGDITVRRKEENAADHYEQHCR